MTYDEMFLVMSKISPTVFQPFNRTMKDLSVSSANTHSTQGVHRVTLKTINIPNLACTAKAVTHIVCSNTFELL